MTLGELSAESGSTGTFPPPLVLGVFRGRYEPAVMGKIAGIVVDPVNLQSRLIAVADRPLEESFEIRSPLIADPNPTATVVVIRVMVWILAALFHAAECGIQALSFLLPFEIPGAGSFGPALAALRGSPILAMPILGEPL